LRRILEGRPIRHPRGIEDRDIRVRSHRDAPLGPNAQPIRRHQRHLAHRLHQRERMLLAHVAAQHPRIGSGGARMPFSMIQNPVARDHRQRIGDGLPHHLLGDRVNRHHAALLPVARE